MLDINTVVTGWNYMPTVVYEIPRSTRKTCMVCDGTGKTYYIYGVRANTECEFIAEELTCFACNGKGFRTEEDRRTD